MENNEEQDLSIEQNEPHRGQNGNNGRNQAPRPFIQPDDPFMLLRVCPIDENQSTKAIHVSP